MVPSCGGTVVGDIIVDGTIVGDITTWRYHPRWYRRVVVSSTMASSTMISPCGGIIVDGYDDTTIHGDTIVDDIIHDGAIVR